MTWAPQHFPYLVQKQADIQNGLTKATPNLAKYFPEVAEDGWEREYKLLTDILDSGAQTWLDTDVCDMLQDTYDGVPEWSPEACMPSGRGIIAFEHTITITVKSRGAIYEMPLDGFCWGEDGGKVYLHAICKEVYPVLSEVFGNPVSSLNPPLLIIALTSFPETATYVSDFSDEEWLDAVDDDRERASFRVSIGAAGVMKPFMRLVGATWLLLSQPAIVEEPSTEQVTMQVRQPPRKRAKGAPKKLAVRVSVRTLSGATIPKSHRGQRGKATTRWWVRGHWRQQAWGKNRALRRPVYIAPHTAGARDVAVDERPQIQVVRKD